MMSSIDDCWESNLELKACSVKSSPGGGDKYSPAGGSPNGSNGKSETEVFGTDPLRTLGEILAYCQVMYEAIQKLDEKFELLQARVSLIQEDRIHIEDDPTPIYVLDDTENKQLKDETAHTTYRLLHHQVPPSPEDSAIPHLVVSSEKCSRSPSAQDQNRTRHRGATSTPCTAVRKMILQKHNVVVDHPDTKSGHSTPSGRVRETLEKRRKSPDRQRHNANAGRRKFVIPSSVLKMAGSMARPTAAARFLMRSLFTHQELLHGSVKGYTARGLKKLNPDKINAIREWVQMTYPEHELHEKGKDWKACLAVMNEGASHVRLKHRKRKFKSVRHASAQASSVTAIKPEPTAEIDVEISDCEGVGDNLQQTTEHQNKVKLKSDQELVEEQEYSCEPGAEVYLGHPDRDVKVPQFALYSAVQRPSPPLVARYLIRFIFPEEVLVQSNVYGNAKHGILPLDHNKISALREYLCERFPHMKLDEDGPSWKACVYAINGAIRKTRHTLKKCHQQAQDATVVIWTKC